MAISVLSCTFLSLVFRLDSCPREVLYEASGTFQWSSIAHGIEVTHPCPRNPQQLAFRRCYLGDDDLLHWSDPDTSACATVSERDQ